MFACICVCVCVCFNNGRRNHSSSCPCTWYLCICAEEPAWLSLSPSLHLLVSVDHPLFVSSELLNISLFFYLPSSTSLSQSRPPSFPLHRLWLASVKPLKRKRVHMRECVCACERACMSVCVCMYEVVLLGWIWTSPCLFCPGGLWNEKGSHCAADLHW